MEVFLDAALAIVGEGGLAALTLRPLAARVGVSVPTLIHYLGSKDQLLNSLILRARMQDTAFQSVWLTREGALDKEDWRSRASLGEAAYRSWILRGRSRAVLFCALLQARSQSPAIIEALAGWSDDWEAFWIGMSGRQARGRALSAYFVDEAFFSLGLSESEPYCLLRQLCMKQVFAGLLDGARERSGELPLFDRLRAELAPAHVSLDRSSAALTGKRSTIAERGVDLIAEGGVESISHRSVAAAAGVPPSTVVYHFGSREDLLVAVLEAVILRVRSWRVSVEPGDRDSPGALWFTRPLVRATTAIAFESYWRPRLAPHAADMRRRRGESVTAGGLPRLDPILRDRLDPLAAQVYSVCAFGARMRAIALCRDEAAAVLALQDALNAGQ